MAFLSTNAVDAVVYHDIISSSTKSGFLDPLGDMPQFWLC